MYFITDLGMYDNLNMRLTRMEVGNVNFLNEIPQFCNNIITHTYPNGEYSYTGILDNLSISINRGSVAIKDGSFCKWFLGNNLQTLGRNDVKIGLEKLSDILHLPMNKAIVSRIDIAQNIMLKHPIEVYLNHLGYCGNIKPSEQPNGVYYHQKNLSFCLYEKIKEQKEAKNIIPELFQKQNCMRMELRLKKRLTKALKRDFITGALLYDEAFYFEMVNLWGNYYKSIQKINDVQMNFKAIKTVTDFRRISLLDWIEKNGGQIAAINQIKDAQKRNELTSKQAYDLRKEVEAIYNVDNRFTCKNDAIIELDQKVEDAIKYQF